MQGDASSFGDDNFQILARHNHRAVVDLVHARDERAEVAMQTFLLWRLESSKRLQHRAVIGLEHLQKVLWRTIAEFELPRLGLDPARGGPEQLGHTSTRAPQHR